MHELPPRPPQFPPDQTGGPEEPWLTREAIGLLDKYLTKDMHVLEFGAGGSSIWFAQRTATVVSIESDVVWYVRILRRAQELKLSHLLLFYLSTAEECWQTLTQLGLFDLVLVDGHSRVECIKRAREHVRPGGWLVLDDAQRRAYRAAEYLLAGWERVITKNVLKADDGMWRTDIYKRADK